MPTRALLLDLFGTIVHFRAPLESNTNAAPDSPATPPRTPSMPKAQWLREVAAQQLPDVEFDALLAALKETTEEIIRERPPEFLEVPSPERFRRALVKVGIAAQPGDETAAELSRVHMHHLASTTYLPQGYAALLAQWQRRYRLVLVSNFDHGPTAHRILAMHGIAEFFEVKLISAEVGRRKPHPSIFRAACEHLSIAPEDALFVGDSPQEDVAGAHAAGIPTAWIDAKAMPTSTVARHVVRDLHDLDAILTR